MAALMWKLVDFIGLLAVERACATRILTEPHNSRKPANRYRGLTTLG